MGMWPRTPSQAGGKGLPAVYQKMQAWNLNCEIWTQYKNRDLCGGISLSENISKIFYEDVAQKRQAASGARYKTGKRGCVGKMSLPSDYDPAVRKSSLVETFTVDELLKKLKDSEHLQNLLLERLDKDYQTFRLAIREVSGELTRVFTDAAEQMLQMIRNLETRVSQMESSIQTWQGHPEVLEEKAIKVKRNTWGATPSEMRTNIFLTLKQMEDQQQEISMKTIKTFYPSLCYWLYGNNALFSGFKDLKRQYHLYRCHSGDSNQSC